MSGNLIVAFALFLLSTAIAVGLSLFVITVVLRMQHKHRKRLARVGRRRLSGRIDMEDARLMLARPKQEATLVVRLTEALSRIVPLLDTARLRAKFIRAGLEWTVATFVSISLAIGAVAVLAGTFLIGVMFFGDALTLGRALGVMLIVGGVATLKLSH